MSPASHSMCLGGVDLTWKQVIHLLAFELYNPNADTERYLIPYTTFGN